MKQNIISRGSIQLLLIAILLQVFITVKSQQQQIFSQYHLNSLAVNPASAGTKGYASLQTTYRKQWQGLEGAPQTSIMSLQVPISAAFGNVGFGVTGYSDKAAAIKRTGASITYAQNWAINDQSSFSLGITGSATQFSLDMNKIAPSLDPGDPLLNQSNMGKMGLDAGFSAYVFSERWSAGVFADNLMERKLNFYNHSGAKLYRHYYFTGQIVFPLDEYEEFAIMPAVLAVMSSNAPSQFDVNLNLIHQKNKWLGVSYRTNQTHSLSANVGFLIAERVVAGYAYDMIAGQANQFNALQNSCHEITLGFRFIQNNNPDLKQMACPLF